MIVYFLIYENVRHRYPLVLFSHEVILAHRLNSQSKILITIAFCSITWPLSEHFIILLSLTYNKSGILWFYVHDSKGLEEELLSIRRGQLFVLHCLVLAVNQDLVHVEVNTGNIIQIPLITSQTYILILPNQVTQHLHSIRYILQLLIVLGFIMCFGI